MICKKRKARRRLHRHHVIPKHAGGTDDPENIVFLSTEDHAEAHRKLYEQYGRWQDFLAWQGLSQRLGREEIISAAQSEANRNRVWKEESKDKLRLVDKSYTQTPEYRENMRLATLGEKNGFFGRKHSEATKELLRQKNLGKKATPELRQKMRDGHRRRREAMEAARAV